MSVSCPDSDCFSDLLCCEDSNSIFSGGGGFSLEYSSEIESKTQDFELEESIAGLLVDERDLAGFCSPSTHHNIDASVRTESVAWILKVQRHYGFQPITAYLSVNYFDRFLHSYQLPKMNGWSEQLLSVACLSLAAKMEEPLVPSLLEFQVEGAKFIFEPKTVLRMELLVLKVLDWRLQSISPFCYLQFFALKIDPTGTFTDFFTSKAKDILLSAIQEICLLEHRPSTIGAAILLHAVSDLPKFSSITSQQAESWCDGLHKESIMNCQQLIRKTTSSIRQKRHLKIYPQLLEMTESSESLFSSSSSSFKRKRLSEET
ncbi:cyclin-D1-1-like [Andrographis paniculata]|uniref:cyclin-D1-1-like n=1 Tax=Andrographis paniculata TaxID=175694 RepID=UPI0021E840F3|nr:cyclin-D1-1-like [Andrographis paniculata]